MTKMTIGTYGTRPPMLYPYNSKYCIRLFCTYGKVIVQILTTSYVESIPSVQIQFTHVIGFSDYRNRGLTDTEER